MPQSEAFSIQIEDRPFTLEEAERLSHEPRGRDWPIVYILTGKGECYVGETQDASSRMRQHLQNPERRKLTRVSLMTSGSFNKSAIPDLESLLIEHMHADGLFLLQNMNAGQSRYHDYYQRLRYQDLFEELWEKLRRRGLAKRSLFDIRNSEIFKYSPYKRPQDRMRSKSEASSSGPFPTARSGSSSITSSFPGSTRNVVRPRSTSWRSQGRASSSSKPSPGTASSAEARRRAPGPSSTKRTFPCAL